MARIPIWRSIADTLTAELAAGLYSPGDKLPTEAALSFRFGVNRHTVRQALSGLIEAGTLFSRRGSGVFVAAAPADYAIGQRVRFHQNIQGSGRTPSRRITRLETRPASPAVARALRLEPGMTVHVIEGISLADGQPLASFCSVFPAARFPGLLAAMAAQSSVTAALLACGLPDYTRAETRLTALLADSLQANALQVQPGSPILRSTAVNVDASGAAVEYGQTWFAGDRVTLTVTA